MSDMDLPEGWAQQTVLELCGKPQYGFTASAVSQPVGPKFLRITDIQNGRVDWSTVPYCRCTELDKYRLRKGDILFARTGATTGKSFLMFDDADAVFASYLIRISPGKDVLPSFIYQYFQSPDYWRDIVSGIDDGNRPNMNGSKLGELTIPYPPQLAEQSRIVARIEELNRCADEARKLRQEAVVKISTQFFHIRRKLFESLSREWPSKPLGKCGKVLGGGTPSKKREDYWNGHIPWIAPKEMKDYRISSSSERITEAAVKESSAKMIPAGSVLFVVRGMILARYVPIGVTDTPCAINQDMKAIVPSEGILSDYLAHMLWGANDLLLGMVETAGHGTKKLETSRWTTLAIPIPDTATQQAVIEELQAFQKKLSELEYLQMETSEDLTDFQSALLAKAFRGEL